MTGWVSVRGGRVTTKDVLLETARGRESEYSIVHKFGTNLAVGTSFVPVSQGGIYQTPQVANATTLRVKAGNDADRSTGDGAREVTIQGLDANGNEITDVLVTDGTSASTATTNTYIRLFRAFVSASGTYATTGTGSHTADVVIENGAGGTDWATIESSDYPRGQSQIGWYSIPTGKTGYMTSAYGQAEGLTNTGFDIIFVYRPSILDGAAPFAAIRNQYELRLAGGGSWNVNPKTPLGPYVGPCDIGWMAKVSTGTAEVDIDFEIFLEPS